MSEPDPAPAAIRGSVADLRQRHGPHFRWLLLISVMTGSMAAIMSSTIVNVAIPGLSHEFDLGQGRAQWVSSGFMLAMTVSMLATPWLLARFGYRRVYLGALTALFAGGWAGGLGQGFGVVLAARVAEGLAAGVVQPIPPLIILRTFEPHEQGRASGVFGMIVVLAPALGPSVGGLLVDWFGWRSIFFMVLPFCLVSGWMALRYVPLTAPGGVLPGPDQSRLDSVGLLLASTSTICLLNGLVALQGRGSTGPMPVLLWLLVSALAGIGFVAWQQRQVRRGAEPLITPDLFRHKTFAMGSLVAFIYGTALFGSTYLIPVYMQNGLGLSPSLVGTLFLPAGLVLAATIAIVGRLADRWPTRTLVVTGLLLLALSFALNALVTIATPLAVLVALAILGRIGLGFILPSLNLGSMRGLSKPLQPQGSSVINFVRTLGGAVGISVCGIVLEWRLNANALAGAVPLLAYNQTFILLAAVCSLALVAAWHLRDAPPT